MIKFLFVGLIVAIGGIVFYKTHPINRVGVDLSFLNTEVLVWEEEWSPMGEGEVVGLFHLSKEDFERLEKTCQSKESISLNNPYLRSYKLKHSDIVCVIKNSSKDRDRVEQVLVDEDKKYFFYRRVIMN